MPQLSSDKAKRVAEAEATGGLIEEGLYTMILVDVEEIPQKDGQVAGQWVWKYQFPEDAPMYAGRQQWRFVSLGEKSEGFMHECFIAVNATPDTNTDELLGRLCQVYIRQVPKYNDPNTIVNKIEKVMPIDPDTKDAPSASGKVTSEDGPLF